MTEHCDRLGFISEPSYEIVIVCKFIFQNFNGNSSVFNQIHSLVNVRHTADADKLGYLIAAVKLLADILIHLIHSV